MSEELKRCPCCKGRAKISTPVDFFCVECGLCKLTTDVYNHEEEAIKAWNTRANNALIDTLVEVLEQCKSKHEQGVMLATVREKINEAIAEAKKWRGE